MEFDTSISYIHCPNCARLNSGINKDGSIKMICPKCGCTLIRKKKTRRSVVIEVIAPKFDPYSASY